MDAAKEFIVKAAKGGRAEATAEKARLLLNHGLPGAFGNATIDFGFGAAFHSLGECTTIFGLHS